MLIFKHSHDYTRYIKLQLYFNFYSQWIIVNFKSRAARKYFARRGKFPRHAGMNPRGAGARGAGERAREISRADRTSERMVNFPLCAFANLEILLKRCYPLRENPCKEGSLVQLAKEFLTRFYIFFKSVDFVLLQEIQPFLHLLHQSSNSIFDFNLRASFARLSFQVNKFCSKNPIE